MSGDLNPYAPPSSEAPEKQVAFPDGSLWRVDEGRLLVRNMASLPDFCVHGSPEDQAGSRRSIVLQWVPRWVIPVAILIPVAAMIESQVIGILGIYAALALAFVLPSILGKSLRVMMFQSDETRIRQQRKLFSVLVLVEAIAAVAASFIKDAGLLPPVLRDRDFIFVFAFTGIILRLWLISSAGFRVAPREEGWFELKGVDPGMIAHLSEIQQRVRIPQKPWVFKRKR